MTIIESIAEKLKLRVEQVQATLDFLDQGATIPFIAHYRKAQTGNLDEEQLHKIKQAYQRQTSLEKRKHELLQILADKNLLRDDLRDSVVNALTLTSLEEICRPYVEKKRKNKARLALEAGFGPLAEALWSQQVDPSTLANQEDLEQASYILAQRISENYKWRGLVRQAIEKYGFLVATHKESNALDSKGLYKKYYAFKESLSSISVHRLLILLRGARENILNLSISIQLGPLEDLLAGQVISTTGKAKEYFQKIIHESLARLMLPALKKEVLGSFQEKAYQLAMEDFGINLEYLLMSPPIKDQIILAWDPGYTRGCKMAMLSPLGDVLDTKVVYPFGSQKKREKALSQTRKFLLHWEPSLVVIGNGAGYLESIELWNTLLKEFPTLSYTVVPKTGISLYTHSPRAKQEFPDFSSEELAAVSLGRRAQDPLKELVKMDPQTLGIGEYQYDLPASKLKEILQFVTYKVVNRIGVNINTASSALLEYVAGLDSLQIQRILSTRNVQPFRSRNELKELLSPFSYEQAIGFLRIENGSNPLDQTAIHPESYSLATQILEICGLSLQSFDPIVFNSRLKKLDIPLVATKLESDPYTIADIIEELIHFNLDPRETKQSLPAWKQVIKLEDLSPGMKLKGVVRNVTSFGVFVDVGCSVEGIVHISHLSREYVENPCKIVHLGQVINVYVYDVDKSKNRLSLTMVPFKKKALS